MNSDFSILLNYAVCFIAELCSIVGLLSTTILSHGLLSTVAPALARSDEEYVKDTKEVIDKVMTSPLIKFFTPNCLNVEEIMDSENLFDGFLLTDKDQNKAPVLVPVPTLQELSNSDPAALVVDHNSYAVSNSEGEHILMATDDFVQPDAILGNKKIEAPVLFEVLLIR
ncbi:hypothetical protein Nepgr_029689 [Nepenthes gracilis]|uniref:Uncharacterized protein n=1 Tax=Nepenthes gracilis TaxID=150966 RepID=A0AAD3TFI3_NEPGR|nr:hypothetical protein Nepgr_029689 [Nepenthes gracilis]